MSGGPIESRPGGETSGQLPPAIHRNPDHSDDVFQAEYRGGHRNVSLRDPMITPRVTPPHEKGSGFGGIVQRSPDQMMGVLASKETAAKPQEPTS